MKITTSIATATLALAGAEASAGWIACAKEGEVCRFDGRREVAFGAGERWVSRQHTGGVKCASENFKGDPAPGVVKSCRVREDALAQPAGQAPWTPCAKESGICRFEGRREVAYGARDKWTYRTFQGSVKCTNESFGRDPIPGVVKSCKVASAAARR